MPILQDDAIRTSRGNITIIDSKVKAETDSTSNFALKANNGNIIIHSNGGSIQTLVEAITSSTRYPAVLAGSKI